MTDPNPHIEYDRIIDGDEVKTFHRKATMMVLDDKVSGDRFEGCEIEVENPVPVKVDDKVIGYATIYVEGKDLVADFFLDYHTPERLSIETKSEALYPYPTMLTAMDNSEGVWRTCAATIVEVLLIPRKPYDTRIEAL